jgi:hypothetical protein
MRLRLGLLQDPAAIDRQIAREAAEIEARRKALKQDANKPTVLTEEETIAAKNLTDDERKKIEEKIKAEEKSKTARRIRPLTEAKAIDSGANFISEAFLFCVAGGLILFEAFRSRKKEAKRVRGVEERLTDLEQEIASVEEDRDRYRELVEEMMKQKDLSSVSGEGGNEAKDVVGQAAVEQRLKDLELEIGVLKEGKNKYRELAEPRTDKGEKNREERFQVIEDVEDGKDDKIVLESHAEEEQLQDDDNTPEETSRVDEEAQAGPKESTTSEDDR